MTTINNSPNDTERLKRQIERIKTEVSHLEHEFIVKHDEVLSRMKEQLEVQATRLDGEIKGRFFERAKLVMWILTILFLAATAGGWWNVSRTIPLTVSAKVTERVESETEKISDHIIDTLKLDLKEKLIDLTAETRADAKKSFDQLQQQLNLNAGNILKETKESVINSIKEIEVKLDNLQKNSDEIITAIKPVYLSLKFLDSAESGNPQKLEELLQQGVDKDFQSYNGKTALIMAADGGHVDIIKILLAVGAAVDVQDMSGRTALIYAAANGYDEIVDKLLLYSARLDLRSKDGSTALIEAVNNKQSSTVRILLKYGDDPNTKNTKLGNGQTPLILAARHGDSDIVKILLDANADYKIEDEQGETALTISQRLGGREDIKNLLIQKAENK